MPFEKVGENDYVSPSGRHFTKKQVRLYYATNGFAKNALRKLSRLRRGRGRRRH